MKAPTFTVPGAGKVVFYMGSEDRLAEMAAAFEAAWLKLPAAVQKFITAHWKGLTHKSASAAVTVGLDPELPAEWAEWDCLESQVDWVFPAAAWPADADAQRRTMLNLFAQVTDCAMFRGPDVGYVRVDTMYYYGFSEDLASSWETGAMSNELVEALAGLDQTIKACKRALKVYR